MVEGRSELTKRDERHKRIANRASCTKSKGESKGIAKRVAF